MVVRQLLLDAGRAGVDPGQAVVHQHHLAARPANLITITTMRSRGGWVGE